MYQNDAKLTPIANTGLLKMLVTYMKCLFVQVEMSVREFLMF